MEVLSFYWYLSLFSTASEANMMERCFVQCTRSFKMASCSFTAVCPWTVMVTPNEELQAILLQIPFRRNLLTSPNGELIISDNTVIVCCAFCIANLWTQVMKNATALSGLHSFIGICWQCVLCCSCSSALLTCFVALKSFKVETVSKLPLCCSGTRQWQVESMEWVIWDVPFPSAPAPSPLCFLCLKQAPLLDKSVPSHLTPISSFSPVVLLLQERIISLSLSLLSWSGLRPSSAPETESNQVGHGLSLWFDARTFSRVTTRRPGAPCATSASNPSSLQSTW